MSLHKFLSPENLASDIKVKVLSANQIAGFSKQLFLQNKWMKQLHFLHVDKSSQKLKVD